MLLPSVKDKFEYHDIFKKSEPWEKAIQFLIEKHKLKGTPTRSDQGSHIVYRVGDTWIKMMAPIFKGDMAFEKAGLQVVNGKLSADTPKILAEGELESWNYILLSHVKGQSLRHIWPQLTSKEKEYLADQMVQITKELACCTPNDVVQSRFNWNEFISDQYNRCYDLQQSKKSLSNDWLENLNAFLQRFPLNSFTCDSVCFLHADLTYDHFLIDEKLKISGIIDMADCQVGHPEYELLAPVAFPLKGEKNALRRYLKPFGVMDSERLLAWCLLHRFCNFTHTFKDEMARVKPGDFSGLAKILFPL